MSNDAVGDHRGNEKGREYMVNVDDLTIFIVPATHIPEWYERLKSRTYPRIKTRKIPERR